jgi:hypothetical protein
MNDIKLNDILRLTESEIKNTKIRFNIPNKAAGNPLEIFKNNREELQIWQFWNYARRKSFTEGNIAVGFIRIEGDKWLLFDISRVTKDLNLFNAVGYEHEKIEHYEKFCGRLIIQYKNKDMTLVRLAESVLNKCNIVQILDGTFDNDLFPGYENVNISWHELKNVINKDSWKTALENQKGVYLITDKSNGKMYVGSAYGNNMIHGRWSDYINNGHGGNIDLKELSFEYIQNNFYYSILDIFKSTIDDKTIIKRESWWKNTLLTRKFGYNN